MARNSKIISDMGEKAEKGGGRQERMQPSRGSQEGGRGYITLGIRVIGLHCNQKSLDTAWARQIGQGVDSSRDWYCWYPPFARIGVGTPQASFLCLASW